MIDWGKFSSLTEKSRATELNLTFLSLSWQKYMQTARLTRTHISDLSRESTYLTIYKFFHTSNFFLHHLQSLIHVSLKATQKTRSRWIQLHSGCSACSSDGRYPQQPFPKRELSTEWNLLQQYLSSCWPLHTDIILRANLELKLRWVWACAGERCARGFGGCAAWERDGLSLYCLQGVLISVDSLRSQV